MSDLTPEDRALLESARGAFQATPDDHARNKRHILARIGVGAGVGAATIASSGAAGAKAAATAGISAIVAKVAAVVVVTGAVGTGLALTSALKETHVAVAVAPGAAVTVPPAAAASTASPAPSVVSSLASAPPPAPLADAPEPPRRPEPAARSAPPLPTPRSGAAAPPAASAVASVHTAPATGPTPPGNSSSPARPAATPPGPFTVDAEAALLRDVDAAVKSGNAARALALLDEHAAKFPAGVLAEEREAERIVVLCALGRLEEARERAAQFLRDRPRSPMARRVRASCGGS